MSEAKETPQVIEDMQYVDDALKRAHEYKLEVELITYALYAMRDNPEYTVQQAIDDAMMEWDL